MSFTTPTSHSDWPFVAKIDGTGQAQWASYYSTNSSDSFGEDVGVDAANNIYFM